MLQEVIETSPCGGWRVIIWFGNFVTRVSASMNPF